MFKSPFPNKIAFSCQSTENANDFVEHVDERIFLSKVTSESRKLHFIAGRSCAREALLSFGIEQQPVLKNFKTHEPIWPNGFCGSITHSGKWAAAAAANQSEVSGIGIDLEYLNRKVDPKLQKYICISEEMRWMESLEKEVADIALKLIFSVKESIFKAYFPSTRIYLHFHDAKVIIGDNLDYFEYQIHIKKKFTNNADYQGHGKIQILNNIALTSLFIK